MNLLIDHFLKNDVPGRSTLTFSERHRFGNVKIDALFSKREK